MTSVAPIIRRSPRQAPAGALASPDSNATATPAIAISTPKVLRAVIASEPNSAPTTIVISGSVESASVPRAAVVWLSEIL